MSLRVVYTAQVDTPEEFREELVKYIGDHIAQRREEFKQEHKRPNNQQLFGFSQERKALHDLMEFIAAIKIEPKPAEFASVKASDMLKVV